MNGKKNSNDANKEYPLKKKSIIKLKSIITISAAQKLQNDFKKISRILFHSILVQDKQI
jgi:hypothetical protein